MWQIRPGLRTVPVIHWGEVTSDDVSKDVIPDGPVEWVQSRNVPKTEYGAAGGGPSEGRRNTVWATKWRTQK